MEFFYYLLAKEKCNNRGFYAPRFAVLARVLFQPKSWQNIGQEPEAAPFLYGSELKFFWLATALDLKIFKQIITC